MIPAPALRFSDVSVAYGRVRVLYGVSFSVAADECFGLVGESGCGKSTAALAALRALPRGGRIVGGTVAIDGQDVTALSPRALRALWTRRVSMVYQDPSRALNPTLTVGAQLVESYALLGHATPRASAEAMLATVHIRAPARVMTAYPHQLSGGMQQRVVIAMALAKDPALLVLDEPTTGLDATVEAGILSLVETLRRERGTAVLLISHNLRIVSRLCDRIGVLYAGRLVEQGRASDVMGSPRHPYTARLLACLPDAGQHKHHGLLQTIPGQLPPPDAPVPACAFAPRCDRADAVCRTVPPPVTGHAGHVAACHFPLSSDVAAALPVAAPSGAYARHPGAGAPVLAVRDLSKTYAGGGGARALSGVSLELRAGETLGVVGESGSGKTTLAKLLLGLAAPDPGGAILLDGAAITTRRDARQRRAVQIVFQNPDSALNRAHRVRRILLRPLARLAGLAGRAREAALRELAARVRLGEPQLLMRPRALSGGLKQRVAIARAFAGKPRVVVCDEPTSALDVSVQAAILNLLMDLQRREGVAYLFISHDLAVVRYLSDRIAVMYGGQVLELGPAEAVLAGPHHPYTAALVAAASHDAPGAPSRGGGEAQAPAGTPAATGCVFVSACPRRIGPVCETTAPEFDAQAPHPIRCHLPPEALPAAASL